MKLEVCVCVLLAVGWRETPATVVCCLPCKLIAGGSPATSRSGSTSAGHPLVCTAQENQSLQAKQRELQAALAHAEKAARAAAGQQEKLESLQVIFLFCSAVGGDGCVEQARSRAALGQQETPRYKRLKRLEPRMCTGTQMAGRGAGAGPAAAEARQSPAAPNPNSTCRVALLAWCAGRAAPGAGCRSGR